MRFNWNKDKGEYERDYSTEWVFISKPEDRLDWIAFCEYVQRTEEYIPDPRDCFHQWMFRIFQAGMGYVIMNIQKK